MHLFRRTRAMGYRPTQPQINSNSPQADGLTAVLTNVDMNMGQISQDTLGTSFRELVTGRFTEEYNASSVFWSFNNDPIQGPHLHHAVAGSGGNRAGINLNDSQWQDDKLTLTMWARGYSKYNSGTWPGASLGRAQGDADNITLRISQSDGRFQGTYNGATSSVTAGATTENLDCFQFVVLHVDKTSGNNMKLWTFKDLPDISNLLYEEDTADISGCGAVTSVNKEFYACYNTAASFLEARYYQRAISWDEAWQMYSQETRWDLYKPAKKYWQLTDGVLAADIIGPFPTFIH